MVKTLTLELLRDPWMMHEASLDIYRPVALDLLANRTIATSLFGELKLPSTPNDIALIAMAGVMTKSDICGSLGSRSLSLMVEQAAANPSIKAIVLLVEDGPGGQANGTQALAETITRARAKKPVLGAISGMACSAHYWTVAMADELYTLTATDMVGCIGVVARMRNPKKADAENQDLIEVYSDLSPDKNIEARDPNAYKQQQLNPMAEAFHTAVRDSRGSRLKLSKENVLSGKTYLGKQAAEFGLTDGILSFNQIVGRAQQLAKKRTQL